MGDMGNKKIIIVGAGISGLSAGCYAQMNGYDSEIYEMNSTPGGLCSSWERNGYTFDGCIQWFIGGNPVSEFYPFWLELGALKDREMKNHTEMMRIEGENRRTLIIYSDIDKLELHLMDISPQDELIIKELADAVRLFSQFKFPVSKPLELYGWKDYIRELNNFWPFKDSYKKLISLTVEEFTNKFIDKFLRESLKEIIPPNYTLFTLVMTLAFYNKNDACFPIGGSLDLAKAMEKRYRQLGGKIFYRSKVKKVLIGNKTAEGIILENGLEMPADIVITSCDSYHAVRDLLGEEFFNEKLEKDFCKFPMYSSMQVSIGINQDVSKIPLSIVVKLIKPIKIGNEEIYYAKIKHYCYDKSLSPKGKSIITVTFKTDFQYWYNLMKDKEMYNYEKEKVGEFALNLLEKRIPGIQSKIEVVDITTPYTYAKYTNLWRGAYMSWITTPGYSFDKSAKLLPSLKNFYMIGQRTMQGGLSFAMLTGRWSIQRICKLHKKQFTTQTFSKFM